ncbi:unnamed protein product [Darwinula stevensoni]|uniref:Rho-GAP domain-containing protein n=1 Tax=Darwinula stevensoni TaxID=69355 RepID=A0A7R8X5P6_9CRUS|nr:unnamed protein product [Darwinula stevensoni]CAG0878832.1 unnamed protein product [Darwinula stevensoni]
MLQGIIDLHLSNDVPSQSQGERETFANISWKKVKLLIEFTYGKESDMFFGELVRAIDAASKRRGPAPDFSWLEDYQFIANSSVRPGSAASKSDASEFTDIARVPTPCEEGNRTAWEDGSNELDIPREGIALGQTPIAARESVVRYQMAMREEAYTDIHHFRIAVINALHPMARYHKVKQVRLVGMLLLVFVQERHAAYIRGVAAETVGTGLMGKMGNKGGVGIRLELHSSTLCFINCHLAAHPSELERRNQDYHEICSRLSFQSFTPPRNIKDHELAITFSHALFFNFMEFQEDNGSLGNALLLPGLDIQLLQASLDRTLMAPELLGRLALRNPVPVVHRPPQGSQLARSHFFVGTTGARLTRCSQIYWLGDLNYRLEDVDYGDALDMIKQRAYEKLLVHDQLKQQQNLQRAFQGFQEGEIKFQPSYKYDPNTEETWATGERQRVPSWCDRILWKGEHIELLEYQSQMSLTLSDHKPISAVFQAGVGFSIKVISISDSFYENRMLSQPLLQIKVIDTVRYRRIYEEVMKKLDKLENEFLPQVSVDKLEIVFDRVRFLEPQNRFLSIANTGQVPVQFEFIKKLNDTSYCKPWLNIQPYSDFLKPGEKRDVELEVYVDKGTVSRLNSGQDQLYDILVLHLDGGKDLFITVTGEYERTSFGLSLNTLVQLKVPIREVPVGKLVQLENERLKEPPGSCYGVPKEIWFLVDHLYNHGLKAEGLFETPGLHSEIIAIRDALDTQLPVELPGSPHSVAEALLVFLEALPEPVISNEFYTRCLEASPNYLMCQQVQSSPWIKFLFPEHHLNLFIYLCAFFKEALLYSADNGLDPKTLASLLSGILFRDPQQSKQSVPGSRPGSAGTQLQQQQLMITERKKANFVYHFLVNELETG